MNEDNLFLHLEIIFEFQVSFKHASTLYEFNF